VKYESCDKVKSENRENFSKYRIRVNELASRLVRQVFDTPAPDGQPGKKLASRLMLQFGTSRQGAGQPSHAPGLKTLTLLLRRLCRYSSGARPASQGILAVQNFFWRLSIAFWLYWISQERAKESRF
jgi:hypothetical protein